MGEHLPIIVVELLLVLGGTIAFGWWQLRDVRRAQAERRAREAAEAEARARAAGTDVEAASTPNGAAAPEAAPPAPNAHDRR